MDDIVDHIIFNASQFAILNRPILRNGHADVGSYSSVLQIEVFEYFYPVVLLASLVECFDQVLNFTAFHLSHLLL